MTTLQVQPESPRPVKNIPIWLGILIIVALLGAVAGGAWWMLKRKPAPHHMNINTVKVAVEQGTARVTGSGNVDAQVSNLALFATKSKDAYHISTATYQMGLRDLLA